MRIVLVAPPWIAVPPRSYGGTELVVDALARGLVDAGHEVLLAASGDSTCPVPLTWLHRTALGTRATTTAEEVAHAVAAYQEAAEWGADIVHDHTVAGPLVGALRSLVPVVATSHGPLGGVLGTYFTEIAQDVKLVAISRAQAAAAPGVPVEAVIHHGLDLSRFPRVGAGGPYALFLGRMSPDKGIDIAIDVARRAGVPLVIAAKMAEDDERRYYESRIRPLLGGGVEYVGEISRAEQDELVGGARCLLNPIRWNEPFGLVAIEALACGTPVVATPRGAMPEIVDDGVTGFIRGGVENLARAVLQVDALDRGRCREVAEARFSMARMARDHVALYRSLLGEQQEERSPRATGPSRTAAG